MKQKKRLDVELNLKSVSDSGEFEGYGSVFGVKDSYSDIVVPGAFQKSLARWKEKSQLPALLWQHKTDEPIGVYTEMREDDVGLYVKGRLLIDVDPLAKRAHGHMKAGSLKGLSIGYILDDWMWNREKEAYELKEIDLWEVSVVTFASNEEAMVTEVKSILGRGEMPPPSMVEKALREVGFSTSQAKGLMAKGYNAIAPREVDVKSLLSIVDALKL